MRTLITGGAGFIGSHLAEVLLQREASVTVVDELSTGSIDNIRDLKNRPGFSYVIDSVMNRSLMAELIAEFLGTLVLILFGTGVVAMVVLFPTSNPGETIHGGFTNITLGWGLGVTMGIYVAGKVSGAHLNPAVTLAFAVFRGFPWRKVLPYSLAQNARERPLSLHRCIFCPESSLPVRVSLQRRLTMQAEIISWVETD